jgi:hypothetical protein
MTLFDIVKKDYKNGKITKRTIDKLITEWNQAYEGGKSSTGKKHLVKEIAKIIEDLKPNVIEPFTSNRNPARIPYSGNTKQESSELESFINSNIHTALDWLKMNEDIADILFREGTVWLRNFWKREVIKKKMMMARGTATELENQGINIEKVIQQDDIIVEETGNGVFTLYQFRDEVILNNPSTRICRNENIIPDNAARCKNSMRWICEERYLSYYEILDEYDLTDEVKKKVREKIKDGHSGNNMMSESSLENYRNNDSAMDTVDMNLSSKALHKKVKVIEYFGHQTLDEKTGIEPMYAFWLHEQDIMLESGPLFTPNKKIPFFTDNFSSTAGSLWGKSLIYFLVEGQNVKNGLIRGILDGVALANGGTKFLQYGSIDAENFMRLQRREKYVMLNNVDGVVDGKQNPIPASTFNLLETINRENKESSGIDGAEAAKNNDDKGQRLLTTAQQKSLGIVRKIANLWSRVFKDWLVMSEVWLDDEQIIELFSNDGNPENDNVDINVFRNSNKTKVELYVNTQANRMAEVHNLNMLMQQAKVLGEQAPASTVTDIVANMFELMDMREQAVKLRNHVPQPDPLAVAEQQMKLLDMEIESNKKQLEVAKIQAEIQAISSKTVNETKIADAKVADTMSNAQYKAAQTEEKKAKATAHRVDSILKPAQMNLETGVANDA